MPAATRPFRFLPQQLLESALRFVQPVRIKRGKGRPLGWRARDSRVHLRKFEFICLQIPGHFRIQRMPFR